MKGDPEKTVMIRFTKPELWELKNNFEASYQEGADGNQLAEQVSDKLSSAYEKFKA